MSPEYSVGRLVTDLTAAAEKKNWDGVDKVLIPRLEKMLGVGKLNNNQVVKALLLIMDDPNPDIRDVAATACLVVDISDHKLQAVVISKAEEMTLLDDGDEGKFAMGRAAAILWKYRQNPESGPEIVRVLGEFMARVQSRGWVDELRENIPSLEGLFE